MLIFSSVYVWQYEILFSANVDIIVASFWIVVNMIVNFRNETFTITNERYECAGGVDCRVKGKKSFDSEVTNRSDYCSPNTDNNILA